HNINYSNIYTVRFGAIPLYLYHIRTKTKIHSSYLKNTIFYPTTAYTELSSLLKTENYSSVFILVDENTQALCLPKFLPQLATSLRVEIIEIEPGEAHKNLETCSGVWNALIELGADRQSLLINLGGGVITDLGGFVATVFKRGIDFVH